MTDRICVIGDNGRRGQLQNLPCGPTAVCPGPVVPDDQFGGPEPDDAHIPGVILRLNDDGSAPGDNPFFLAGTLKGGEVGANIQKIFAYGLRNSFGMAFDPVSGSLWKQENGDDSFGLQQPRWPPTLIADTPAEALSLLFVLPGSNYSAPEFSWKFEVAPAGIGFVKGRALGPQYEGDLFVGGARNFLEGGHLFHFNLTGNRRKIAVDDPRLKDRVADNLCKFDIT